MFLLAALHNLIGGFIFIFGYSWIYGTVDALPPQPGVHYQTWIGLIFIFGLIYYMIYQDMYAGRKLVIIGILGKLNSAAPMFYGIVTGNPLVPWLFVIPVITDISFTVYFIAFFVHARRNQLWTP